LLASYRGFRKRWRDVINLHPGSAKRYNAKTANDNKIALEDEITGFNSRERNRYDFFKQTFIPTYYITRLITYSDDNKID